MGYHGNMKILLPWGVLIHRIFYRMCPRPPAATPPVSQASCSYTTYVPGLLQLHHLCLRPPAATPPVSTTTPPVLHHLCLRPFGVPRWNYTDIIVIYNVSNATKSYSRSLQQVHTFSHRTSCEQLPVGLLEPLPTLVFKICQINVC